jgi:hypothetical protein
MGWDAFSVQPQATQAEQKPAMKREPIGSDFLAAHTARAGYMYFTPIP